jgi:hypothetical protein
MAEVQSESERDALAEQLNSSSEIVEAIAIKELPVDGCNRPLGLNDPFAQGGFLDYHNLPCAWDLTKGSPNVKLAIVDIFFDQSHPDLQGKIDIMNSCNIQLSACNHGFTTAGAAVAVPNNGVCTAGSGYNLRVGAYCCGSSCNSGNPRAGILQAFEDGYDIISVSFSGTALTSAEMTMIADAGVLMVVSGSTRSIHSGIAGTSTGIKVGRTNLTGDFITYVSSNGNGESDIDMFVMAENVGKVRALGNCENSPNIEGTSWATPFLAGVAGLVKSVNPCLSARDIKTILQQNGQGYANNYPRDVAILDAEAAVEAALVYEPEPVVFSSDTQIEGESHFSGDVIVQNGVELVVTGTMKMGQNARIIVERNARLYVKGGTITNAACSNQWPGIIVEGNSVSTTNREDVGKLFVEQPIDPLVPLDNYLQAGVIYLTNGATIENAGLAITCEPHHRSWPEFNDYYGGLIVAESANFINNYRSIAFMAYGVNGRIDNSRIESCYFDGGRWTITNWASDGVQIVNSDFTNYEESAVLGYDAGQGISKNTFEGKDFTGSFSRGVDLIHTFPNFSNSSILNNAFIDNGTGIFSSAGGLSLDLIVRENDFLACYDAIRMDGHCDVDVRENMIDDSYRGVIMENCGSSDNVMRDNLLNGCTGGLVIVEDNENFEFLTNCFSNSKTVDAVMTTYQSGGYGRIKSTQGVVGGLGASNCFSHNGITSIRVRANAYQSTFESFTYVTTPDGVAPECYTPNGSIIGYQLNKDALSFDFACVDGRYPPSEPYCTFKSDLTCDEYQIVLDSILIVMSDFAQAVDSSDALQMLQLEQMLDCYLNVYEKGLKVCIPAEDTTDVHIVCEGIHRDVDLLMYGYLMSQGRYSSADLYLDAMLQCYQDDEEIQDFIAVQKVNIKYHRQPLVPVEENDLSTVITVAHQKTPLSAYARSVYFAISQKRIVHEIPEFEDEALEERVNQYDTFVNAQSVYPTITHDMLYFSQSTGLQHVSIYSITGTLLLSLDDVESPIDVSTLPQGLYIITTNTNDGTLTSSSKFIKQ